jgi:hypothetical protein
MQTSLQGIAKKAKLICLLRKRVSLGIIIDRHPKGRLRKREN